MERILPNITKALYQWDSFRLWEAFSAGCLVIHTDLDEEGCVLPVMPQNGFHYLGLNLKNPRGMRERILKLSSSFGQIAQNGREWALANYSPRAIAQRFLLELGYQIDNS